MRKLLSVLAFVGSACHGYAAADLDSLTDAEVTEALSQIQTKYVDPAAVNEAGVNRAQLAGFLKQMPSGVVLVSGSAVRDAAVDEVFKSEMIGNVGYLRVGALTAENVTKLDAVLGQFQSAKIGAVILDLRATPVTTDFEPAAEVTRRFTTKGRLLFTLNGRDDRAKRSFTSNQDPSFTGLLIVVVGSWNAGAAEVVAQALRQHAGAIIVGQKTSGRPAEYAEVPFAGGSLLRVAVAEIEVADAASIFPEGVIPDISVAEPEAAQREALREGLAKGVAALIAEEERPRFNEAALVAGVNPEVDALQEAQARKGKEKQKRIRDVVLQRAMDVATSINVLENGHKP